MKILHNKITGILLAMLLLLTLFLIVTVFFVKNSNDLSISLNTDTEVTSLYAGKKILYINSYHEGYAWSDGITNGIKRVLAETDIDLKIHAMDTKRNTSETFKNEAARIAKIVIDEYKPDVILVSDDNAFKYLIQPYYKDADIPVVFSGLNWDASVYDAPYSNTTGMVEVSLPLELIEILREYTNGDKVGYLTADVLTERKNAEYYAKLFDLNFDKKYFVLTMDAWEEAFLALQEEVDIIIFENNAGITDWDSDRAEAFVLAHTKIPAGTTNPWIMPYALIGLTKLAEEQGEWSAGAALKILDGTLPSDIPIVTNKRGELFINLKIAEILGIRIRPDLLKNAEIVN